MTKILATSKCFHEILVAECLYLGNCTYVRFTKNAAKFKANIHVLFTQKLFVLALTKMFFSLYMVFQHKFAFSRKKNWNESLKQRTVLKVYLSDTVWKYLAHLYFTWNQFSWLWIVSNCRTILILYNLIGS